MDTIKEGENSFTYQIQNGKDFSRLHKQNSNVSSNSHRTSTRNVAEYITTENRINDLQNTKTPVLGVNAVAPIDSKNCKNTSHLPSYATAIISKEEDVNAILGSEMTSNPNAKVYYITDFNQLSEGNLTEKHWVSKDENTGDAVLNESPGSLYTKSDNPVILVIDYTKMNINTIVGFNSLYDNPPTLNGKNLASNVKIISVVDSDLSNAGGPGKDFWRRVLETKNFINTKDNEYLEDNSIFSSLTSEKIQEANEPDSEDKNDLIVRLAGENWRNELFGHLDLDLEHNICYVDGKLARLTKNQCVYFQDAPLDDKNFAIEINKIIEDGGYTANNKFIKLPAGVKFYHCKTNEQKLEKLQNKFKWDIPENQSDYSQPGKTRILNGTLFFAYMQEAAVENGKLVKHDVFKNWIDDNTSVIRVTTKLSENQWHTLLAKLEKLGRTDICIIQDDPNSQPSNWRKENKFQPKNIVNKDIKIVLDDLGFIPNVEAEKQEDKTAPLVVQLSPDSYTAKLTSKIKGISLKERHFDMEDTEFLQALVSGRPIDIYGLEYNYKLMCELESLLNNPPSLTVNGFCKTFPDAKINFHLPNNTKLPTVSWKILKQNAQEVYKQSLQQMNNNLATKYYKQAGIDEKLSKKAFDTIVNIVEEANKLPIYGKSPSSKVVLCEYFFHKIWKQAILEQQLDGTKKINKSHFQKALNSIFAKRYRDEPEQYRYIKFLIGDKFSTESATMDLVGLSHWVKKQKEITKDVIKENFWTVSQYIPLKNLKLKKNIFDKFKEVLTLDNIKKIFTVKKLFSSLLSLLKYTILIPYYVVKNIYIVLKYCFILLSKIIPQMETREFPQSSLRIKEAKTISLKDAAVEGSEALDFVYKTILATIEDKQQKSALQQELGISDEKILKHEEVLKKYTNNCYQIEKMLRDICYSVDHAKLDATTQNKIARDGYQKLCHDLSTRITKKLTEFTNTDANKKEEIKAQIIAEIDKLLETILPEDENKEARSELSAELLLCVNQETVKSFWKHWFNRRKQRCASRLATHPLVMIKGYSGSGKSYIAKEIARKLNPNEDPITVNVKADMSAEDVYESFKLENKEITYIKGKLRQWAELASEGYHTLILDEFTLTRELWDGLKTVGENPPYINLDGEKIPLTDKHRIIMTSNPDYFQGRKANEVLTSMTAEMFYFPLSEDFQKQQIIAPEVSKFIERIKFSTDINKNNEAVDKITTCVQDLYSQYAKIIPDYEFTPRDLTDCCSRMETYFSDYITGENKAEITIEMIYAVARESMKQSIANSASNEFLPHLEAIDIWHKARFLGDDKIINEMEKRYDEFYDSFEIFLRKGKDENLETLNLTNKVTQKLVRIYFMEIQRLLLETETGKVHGGRHSILVKSSPGQGKDCLWLAVVNYFEQERGKSIKNNAYTANHKSIEEISNQLNIKFKEGGAISISEFNAYNSQTVEGMSNDLLTDRPLKPGFLVLATINDPGETKGRNYFSSALLSRFTQYNIEDYDFDGLKKICKQQIDNDAYVDAITKTHWRVISAMKKAGKNAVPSIADIKKVAIKASKPNLVSAAELSRILEDNYTKYLKLLGYDIIKRKIFFADDQIDDEVIEANYMPDLTSWINNQTDNKFDATVVRKGVITSYNPKKGVVSLSSEDREKPVSEQQAILLNTINDRLLGVNQQQENSILKANANDADANANDPNANGVTGNEPTAKTESSNASSTETKNNKIGEISSKDPLDADVKSLLDIGFIRIAKEALKESIFDIKEVANNHFDSKNKEPSGFIIRKFVEYYILSGNKELIQSFYDNTIRNNPTRKSSHSTILIIEAVKPLKNLVNRALAELEKNKILEDQQTEKLLKKHDITREDVLETLNKIIDAKDVFEVKDKKGLAIFDLLLEIDSPVCNMLCCSVAVINKSVDKKNLLIEGFCSAVARGNINYKTAIALLESNHNITLRLVAAKKILYSCCETLKQGRNNIDNISAIVKYLIKREGDYFDSKTLYSLLEISEMCHLQNLADEVKKVLDTRYQKMLSHDIKIKTSLSQKSQIKTEGNIIPDQARKLLVDTINTNLDKILKTDVEQIEVNTSKPTGKIDIPKFLAGRQPFKDIIIRDTTSSNVMITENPASTSMRLTATFYDKTSNQILDFNSFLFDEIGKPKFLKTKGKDFKLDSGVIDEIEEKLDKYLESKGIIDKVKYKAILIHLIIASKSLYSKSSRFLQGHVGLQHFLHCFYNEDITKYLQENAISDVVHIPANYISRLISKQILARTGQLQYCLRFNHSSEVGLVKVKSLHELENLVKYINERCSYRLRLQQLIPDDKEQYERIMSFEKRKIKELTRNDNLVIFHQQDLESLIN